MNVPLVDLKRQYEAIKPEIDSALHRVVESGQFILGPEVERFEKQVARYCDVKHAIGVASGTDAILLALKALDIGAGDCVVVPAFTFFATAGAVCNVDAQPVFADIEPSTFNIDPNHVEKLLRADAKTGRKVKAVIPVHIFGQMADMDPLVQLAQRYGASIVEDAAQAIGSKYRERRAGTIGQLGCFSFFPTKNLGAYGDGGLITANDDSLADRVRLLRVHGSRPKYYHRVVGINSRLDAIQAAILNVKLMHLDDWSNQRALHARDYTLALNGLPYVVTPTVADGRTHIYHQYTIRVEHGKRNSLQAFLKEQGVATEIYYPLPLHLQECFSNLGHRTGDLPESERASSEALSLPLFPEMTSKEIRFVTDAIGRFCNSGQIEGGA